MQNWERPTGLSFFGLGSFPASWKASDPCYALSAIMSHRRVGLLRGNMQSDRTNSVELTENLGEWFVRVVRNGKAHISTFEVEQYARSFAEGQRIALGLASVVETHLKS